MKRDMKKWMSYVQAFYDTLERFNNEVLKEYIAYRSIAATGVRIQ